MESINLKLANMRKEQEFTVQSLGSDRCIIQSNKSIGAFNLADGTGKLNVNGCYFPHLAFAKPYNLTDPQLIAVRAAMVKPGDIMGYVGGSPVIYSGTKEY